MEHSRKFYAIDADAYKRLLNRVNGAESAVKEFNEQHIGAKVIDQNQKDAAWKETENRWAPIVTAGVRAAAPSAPLSAPPISSEVKTKDIVTELESTLGSKYRMKGIKLYNLLQKIDGVILEGDQIVVDGQMIRGDPASILSNLVKNQGFLSYDSHKLLEKAVLAGHGSLLKQLVENKEGKQFLKEFMANTTLQSDLPLSASTPKSGKKKRKRKGEDESNESTRFFEAEQTGSNKRVKWSTLFNHGRKQRNKRAGGSKTKRNKTKQRRKTYRE